MTLSSLIRLTACLSVFLCPVIADDRPAKPNILLFMVDDMGVGDSSAYLGKKLTASAPPIERATVTPRLEDFAQNAITFTNAHAPASMCSSTRYSLLTGRWAHRCYLKHQGWLPHGPNRPMIQDGITTMPEMLKQNGYTTACIGKWHVGLDFDNGMGQPAVSYFFHDVDLSLPLLNGPLNHGFDRFFGVPGNTEHTKDTDPRIYIRNDKYIVSDPARLIRTGMKRHGKNIITADDWDLRNLGPDYLREATEFLTEQATAEQPFFLYFVPNANHLQVHEHGDYAVPDEVAGVPIKGASRYNDGSPAGERSDMILENDVIFGELVKWLGKTEDPRWPGHQLIENTLIVFTSDNGPNTGNNLGLTVESGGLRGKKARIFDGGLRVPFLLSWPAVLPAGTENRELFSLTDLYATFAEILDHPLAPTDAMDSHGSWQAWQGNETDDRSRVFFCSLGPPYLNDALAIKKGSKKLIVKGGLALPSIEKGTRGACIPAAWHDLDEDYRESGDFHSGPMPDEALALRDELLQQHNQGYSRELQLEETENLLVTSGWGNPRNDITGEIGFEFSVTENGQITALGMWDSHHKDKPQRSARNTPNVTDRDQPGHAAKGRHLSSPHKISLYTESGQTLASIDLESGSPGKLEGEFRYLDLDQPVSLTPGKTYRLTQSTTAGDGDFFRDAFLWDGLSPVVNPKVEIHRAIRLAPDSTEPKPLVHFTELAPDFDRHRLPVGPVFRLAEKQ